MQLLSQVRCLVQQLRLPHVPEECLGECPALAPDSSFLLTCALGDSSGVPAAPWETRVQSPALNSGQAKSQLLADV